MATLELGLPANVGRAMRAAVAGKTCEEVEKGEYISRSHEFLMQGDYDMFDKWDMYDEEALGIDELAFPDMPRDAHLGVIS